MRRTILFILLTVSVAVIAVYLSVVLAIRNTPEPRSYVTVTLPNERVIRAWTAQTTTQQIQGLSGVEELPLDHGMIFLYEDQAERGFWMKDMLFSLDLIWLRGQMIVGLEENLKPEFPVTTIYRSPEPVDRVLEVNAGFIQANGLEIGDILDIQAVEEYSSVE